jgi:hypothetical protein
MLAYVWRGTRDAETSASYHARKYPTYDGADREMNQQFPKQLPVVHLQHSSI